MTAADDRPDVATILLEGMSSEGVQVVRSSARRLLVVAGAGAGKTEAMARRIAWWHGMDGVPKDRIVAFTFTERAAEEMKFRVRRFMSAISPDGDDPSLGGMYVGTIHSYCLNQLRALWPQEFHNDEIVDDVARYALVQQGFNYTLGLHSLQSALGAGKPYPPSRADTIDYFLTAYDLLNEYNHLEVHLPVAPRPEFGHEAEWCKGAELAEPVGDGDVAEAFSSCAAKYYAYLRCRHFLDFSTSQSELVRRLDADTAKLAELRSSTTHLVIDEVQDVNQVQDDLRRLIIGSNGHLTAVGDHRQAIYGFRGGRVDLMADLAAEVHAATDGEMLEMTANYRSTSRIVDVSNRWNTTIDPPAALSATSMIPGRVTRTDADPTHVMTVGFDDREDEALWIAESIQGLVEGDQGAFHDTRGGSRGITYSDIGVLVRSSTDARTYQEALRIAGIPAVVRAGPDLFAQPEVLLFASALYVSVGRDDFPRSTWNKRTIGNRLEDELGVATPSARDAIPAAYDRLTREGLPVPDGAAERLLLVADAIAGRMTGDRIGADVLASVKDEGLRDFLRGRRDVRRVFPQTVYQWLLAEGAVSGWDDESHRGQTAMFHLGQLSGLVTGIETPGWSSPSGFRYQVQSLMLWASKQASPEEAPLMVSPDAVTVSTIHSVKGLEFAAVFVADVVSRRFPSQFAKRGPDLPYSDELARRLSTRYLADNDNLDGERRLMYVALTRAERYLFITSSKPSKFFRQLEPMVAAAGGKSGTGGSEHPTVTLETAVASNESRLVTSFSDLRYFIECPHDFYLRKVLGFTPTIDQAFGYGRGVHNLMREVHLSSAEWAALTEDPAALEARLTELVGSGMFYLRHTTGEPARLMREKGVKIVADYVTTYGDELSRLEFEPEREFEVLLPEENVLVTGAIDVVRMDSPPRVSIIDFKSGEAESDRHQALDHDEMRLQVSIYAIAAKQELQYEPEMGLVRYLAEPDPGKRELQVPLADGVIEESRRRVADLAGAIQGRKFRTTPSAPNPADARKRCGSCDFEHVCSLSLK